MRKLLVQVSRSDCVKELGRIIRGIGLVGPFKIKQYSILEKPPTLVGGFSLGD